MYKRQLDKRIAASLLGLIGDNLRIQLIFWFMLSTLLSAILPNVVDVYKRQTYDDHRVAMSFAVAGLAVDGIVIKNPMCCRKTFENYFDVLETIEKEDE